jgi:hypothetical protein
VVDLGFLWPVLVSHGLRIVFTVGDFVFYGLRFWSAPSVLAARCSYGVGLCFLHGGSVASGDRVWWICGLF